MAFNGLLISLFLHAALTAWIVYHPPQQQRVAEAVEVEIINEPPATATSQSPSNKTVVLKAEVPLSELTNVGKARFFSEYQQRVKLEQQARLSGLTENRGGGVQAPREQSKNQDQVAKPQVNLKPDWPKQPRLEPSEDKEGLAAAGKQLPPQAFAPRPLNQGASRINESMPSDVKLGDFTALNTDQYLFYSFYARIAPMIRFHWERNVERAINELTVRNFTGPKKSEWDTAVDVVLDSKGYLINTIIERESKIDALDKAVIQAFKSSTPFLNPPKEMIQEDGRIHLRYAFRVFWTPRQLAQPAARL
jgi:hypothetical protein